MTGTNILQKNEVCFPLGNEFKFEPALILFEIFEIAAIFVNF